MGLENLKSKVLSGLLWRLGELMTSQGVSFLVSLFLARLIAPNEYGVIALLMVFIEIANVFVVDGFGSALVQKKDADDLDFSSVFYFNLTLSVLIYIIFFFSSDFIANFYNNPNLSILLKVLTLKIVISSINSIQHAHVQRHMAFKRFFFSTLVGTIISAVVGIFLAYHGYGAWALVFQYLINSTIDTIVLLITVHWYPKLMFSFNRLRSLFSFGWKILCSSLLHSIYTNLRTFVIGKVYSPSDLAFYNQGGRLPQMVSVNINSTISSVLFPAMSKAQDDKVQLKAMVRRAIKTSSYIIWPLLMGLAAVADQIVDLLFSSVWLPCVPFLIISCFSGAFDPVQMANIQAVKAIGRSDTTLKMEFVKKTYGILIIIATIPYGVMAVALGALSQSLIALLVNTYPNRKYLSYSYREQVTDVFPPILLSILMALIVHLGTLLMAGLSNIIVVLISSLFGIVLYLVSMKLFVHDEYMYMKSLVKIG